MHAIPLESIADCGLDARAAGRMSDCAGDLPVVCIDATSSGNTSKEEHQQGHEAAGVGLKNCDWFAHKVMRQQGIVKGGPPAQPVALAGGGKSAEERIAEIQNLCDKGIVITKEYEEKWLGLI